MTIKAYKATARDKHLIFDPEASIYGIPFSSRLGAAMEYQDKLASLFARAVYQYNGESFDLTKSRHYAYVARNEGLESKALEFEVLTDVIINHDSSPTPTQALRFRAETQLGLNNNSSRITDKTIKYLGAIDIVEQNSMFAGKLDAPKNRIIEARLPSPNHFLDLDAPLDRQPQYVKERLDDAGIVLDKTSGNDLYARLAIRDLAGPAKDKVFNSVFAANAYFIEQTKLHTESNPTRLDLAANIENLGENLIRVRSHSFLSSKSDPAIKKRMAATEYLKEIGILGSQQNSVGGRRRYMIFSEDLAETTGIITRDHDQGPLFEAQIGDDGRPQLAND